MGIIINESGRGYSDHRRGGNKAEVFPYIKIERREMWSVPGPTLYPLPLVDVRLRRKTGGRRRNTI
ncbi:hypothetical protein HOLleu_33120 [Holothuria leucospilota]|uniref:Uncharacterized protein n=1 Tax=Holothuria leucospilota TaxID=206669 RepID=A0A9Q1BH21_HOLLE|nr:hypothetical protein HOLleu_33120 [Holothuria leucospilota]